MKYYKYDFQVDVDDNRTFYIETEDGWTLRQLAVGTKGCWASNVRDDYHRLALGEGYVDYDAFDEVIPINEAEFNQVWNEHLCKHEKTWNEIKRNYPIGANVAGRIQVFFPQGVIVDLDENALGVANRAECVASAPSGWIPGTMYKITAQISGYDEQNQWIVLSAPQVHDERVSLNTD